LSGLDTREWSTPQRVLSPANQEMRVDMPSKEQDNQGINNQPRMVVSGSLTALFVSDWCRWLKNRLLWGGGGAAEMLLPSMSISFADEPVNQLQTQKTSQGAKGRANIALCHPRLFLPPCRARAACDVRCRPACRGQTAQDSPAIRPGTTTKISTQPYPSQVIPIISRQPSLHPGLVAIHQYPASAWPRSTLERDLQRYRPSRQSAASRRRQ